MTKSENTNWWGLNRKGAMHSATMEIQKYIKWGIQIDSVTYSSMISVLMPR